MVAKSSKKFQKVAKSGMAGLREAKRCGKVGGSKRWQKVAKVLPRECVEMEVDDFGVFDEAFMKRVDEELQEKKRAVVDGLVKGNLEFTLLYLYLVEKGVIDREEFSAFKEAHRDSVKGMLARKYEQMLDKELEELDE